ncbi:MAG: methylated-DNA--[protein]-cysteine S-methyltransferase [Chlorobiaceae bacterium]|nr:methylated-DNA--[protein]-cysteine S-methyltransferase [Chlorobiaceae bacterium]
MEIDFRLTAIGRVGITESNGALTGLVFGDPVVPVRDLSPGTPLLGEAFRQLEAWLDGEIRSFTLPLAPAGTEFMLGVWAALKDIPYGQTRTYRDIALLLGCAGASRAVGTACARNPLPLFIPCHRVVRSDGTPGGYRGGGGLKARLLDFERRHSG